MEYSRYWFSDKLEVFYRGELEEEDVRINAYRRRVNYLWRGLPFVPESVIVGRNGSQEKVDYQEVC